MFLILSPAQDHSSIISKSLQEMPNSWSWYRGGPKESQLLALVTSTDSLTKLSRMSIETSNCWSILFLPSREIKGFIKTSCCRSSTTLDDECKARRVIYTISLRLSAHHPCRIKTGRLSSGFIASRRSPSEASPSVMMTTQAFSLLLSRAETMSFTLLWTTSLIWRRQRRRNWRASHTGIPRRYCRRRECKLTSVISKAVIFNSCLLSKTV
jgi:hypothetical protein